MIITKIITLSLVLLLPCMAIAQGAGTLLDLGSGGSNYVNCGSPASLEISSAITIEAWIYPTTFDATNEVCAKVGGDRSGNNLGNDFCFNIELSNGVIKYGISHDGSSMVTVSGTALSANQWYHVALTYDGAYLRGYLNGYPDGTPLNTPGSVYTSTSNPFYIGDYQYYYSPFRGKIDEVRIWSTALSQQSIQEWMHRDVTSSHPNFSNLKGYWKLNDGSGTTATDSSGNSADATLQGECTWAISTVPLGSQGAFVNTTSTTAVGPTGGQVQVHIISTPDSINNLGVYQYGSLNGASVTGESYPSGVNKRSNIVWGIGERGVVTARVYFMYGQIPGISQPLTVKLIKRIDASSTTWTTAAYSTRDNVNRIIIINSATDFGEYAIGAGSGNPLPVELESLSATSNGSVVQVRWSTVSEIDNAGFDVERRFADTTWLENAAWSKVGFVPGAGTSTGAKKYIFNDNGLPVGRYVYRLKQVDRSGGFQYSREVVVDIGEPSEFAVYPNYPNPFNPSTTMQYALPTRSRVRLQIYNLLGQIVADLVNTEQVAGWNQVVWNADVSSGLYFYRLEATSVSDPSKRFVDVKKMILLK